MLELGLDVAVVDVHHDRSRLEDGDHRLDRLEGVSAVQTHPVAGLHAQFAELVRERVGARLEFGIGPAAIAGFQGDALRNQVDGMLDEVGNRIGHGSKLERVIVLGKCGI